MFLRQPQLCIQMARPERADAGPWPETRPPDIRGRRDYRAPRSVGACAVWTDSVIARDMSMDSTVSDVTTSWTCADLSLLPTLLKVQP